VDDSEAAFQKDRHCTTIFVFRSTLLLSSFIRPLSIKSFIINKKIFGLFYDGLSYKSARKLPRKRKVLMVQVEFGKIISIGRTELCFVNA